MDMGMGMVLVYRHQLRSIGDPRWLITEKDLKSNICLLGLQTVSKARSQFCLYFRVIGHLNKDRTPEMPKF